MATVNTYLNFSGNTEEAFEFYRSIFGGEFEGGIYRFRDMPTSPDTPPMNESDKNLIMHVSLPILGGYKLMGSDAPESMGFKVNPGNNIYISLHPDSRTEADRLFLALSSGGTVEMPMGDMFWGDYYGSLKDKYGIQWMVNYHEEK